MKVATSRDAMKWLKGVDAVFEGMRSGSSYGDQMGSRGRNRA